MKWMLRLWCEIEEFVYISIIINLYCRTGARYKYGRHISLIWLVCCCSCSLLSHNFFIAFICFFCAFSLFTGQLIKLILLPKYKKNGSNHRCYLYVFSCSGFMLKMPSINRLTITIGLGFYLRYLCLICTCCETRWYW